MPFADWNFDGTVDLSDQSAYTSDKNADTGLGRGDPGYAWSHAGGALRKAYAGYEIEPVLTGSEGWESVYHVRHRVYLSRLGRWTRRDPLGYVDGVSLYGYASHAPVFHRDPTGLSCQCGNLDVLCFHENGAYFVGPECHKLTGHQRHIARVTLCRLLILAQSREMSFTSTCTHEEAQCRDMRLVHENTKVSIGNPFGWKIPFHRCVVQFGEDVSPPPPMIQIHVKYIGTLGRCLDSNGQLLGSCHVRYDRVLPPNRDFILSPEPLDTGFRI
jgi:RHS repeat-associated protein